LPTQVRRIDNPNLCRVFVSEIHEVVGYSVRSRFGLSRLDVMRARRIRPARACKRRSSRHCSRRPEIIELTYRDGLPIHRVDDGPADDPVLGLNYPR
jgi:hypothetical protein